MADITTDLTTCSDAESTTGWSGDSFVLENEIFVQGSNSVAVIQTANGTNDVIFTKASGSWDMSSQHLRTYMSSNIMPNTKSEALDGIQMFAGDGTNTAYWTVGGADTYSGGWKDFFIDVDSTPTSGTVNTAAVTLVGIRINTSSKPRNSTNGWYDYFRFGNGLTINSTTTEAVNFQDVANADALTSNAWGILQESDGVFFGKGKLTLGDLGSKNCNLVSVDETIFFVDRIVSSNLYGIVAQEGTGATDVDITGLVCKTVGTSAAELDFSAAVNSFSMDGCTFLDMGTMTFATGTVTNTKFNGCGITDIADGLTFTGNTWISSGQIDLNLTGALDSCTIDSSSATSAILSTDLSDMTDCTFKSDGTGHAIEITSIGGGTMSWDNYESGYAVSDGSTGNETIYVNVGSGTLDINVGSGYSIPTIRTAGATVNVVSGQVTTEITVKNISDGLALENARVYLVAGAGGPLTEGTVIFNTLTDVSGQVSDTRSLGSNQPVTGRVRLSTSPNFFKSSPIVGTINSTTGLTLTVQLIPDN